MFCSFRCSSPWGPLPLSPTQGPCTNHILPSPRIRFSCPLGPWPQPGVGEYLSPSRQPGPKDCSAAHHPGTPQTVSSAWPASSSWLPISELTGWPGRACVSPMSVPDAASCAYCWAGPVSPPLPPHHLLCACTPSSTNADHAVKNRASLLVPMSSGTGVPTSSQAGKASWAGGQAQSLGFLAQTHRGKMNKL